jgi:hypothetical protein
MAHPSSPRAQRGYLLEVPLILAVIGVVVAIVLPKLPPLGQKIFLSIIAVPVLFGLYYMIVIPGWMPNDRGRLRPPWSLLVFVAVAGLIAFGLVMFIING